MTSLFTYPRTTTKGGASFVDQFDIKFGPRSEIAQYFLAAEAFMSERGITLARASPMEMVKLNRAETNSWWRQVPILDAEDNPPIGDELVALIGRDASGREVTAMSVRQFSIAKSLRDEMESLRMFFGQNAAIAQDTIRFRITAPSAERIAGNVAYMGGLWVHPDKRGMNLSLVVPRLARYISLGLWGCDFDLSLTLAHFYTKQKVIDRYDFEAIEPHFTYKLHGKTRWEGSLVWSSRAQLEANLAKHLSEVQTDISMGNSGGQKAIPPIVRIPDK